jgi:putative ABC transport system permease protein
MVRSFLKLYNINFGYAPDHLVAMEMRLPDAKYRAADDRRAFFDRLTPALASIPGARAVALTTSVPPFNAARRGFVRQGAAVPAPGEAPQVAFVHVTPAFFSTLGVALVRGRDFAERDGSPGMETVIINERFASQYFRGEDPIGQRIRFVAQEPRPGQTSQPEPWRTIVGIAPTLRHASFHETEAPAAAYVPYREDAVAGVTLLVRSDADPGTILNAVRAKVQTLDRDQPVFTARTLDQILWQQMWPYRVFGSLFAIFAAIALIMSAVGLYAVMAYSVEQRTPEIGVRMALGAERRQVSWLILKRGLVQLAMGLALGLLGAVALSRVIAALLVQVSPTDPLTFAGITLILAFVAIAACLVPAQRATRVDPLVALRTE